jgi:tRNA(fMet)-specific endonuclease VapC
MACLDTTVFVDLRGRAGQRHAARAAALIDELLGEGESIVSTRLNLAELYVGVERSRNPDLERQVLAQMMQGVTILDFDEIAARHFGRFKAHLFSIGEPAGDIDVLVASIALTHDHTLVTRNERHFRSIPGLAVRSY